MEKQQHKPKGASLDQVRKAQQELAERASKFDADTRDQLRKHDEGRKVLVKGRAAERDKLMAEKLAAGVAVREAEEAAGAEPAVEVVPPPVVPAVVPPKATVPAAQK